MADLPPRDTLVAEFDCLMAWAGIRIPDTRRAAALAAYTDLRGQLEMLHGRYSAANEPSNVFRLSPMDAK
jgi:hypothetical protein